ncbi:MULTISPECIES: enoyl-CoA hydratase/isomerase family protein [Streptomyces]|uniref:Enoyl-CoA hydratase/carnithine racemase n=1 Tax=Streptomyces atratus TaxID=1893 RepID=A0A1K1X6A5_STRAR|nr:MULTISPECIES: enoyl-CoA hydratase/isomerase family protein [Streptomyces]MCX4393245.1 enoyl-CoA hydratase/isomerase family protein [Streptomyces sp. NBC_01767]MCX4849002.1 enoyl-CoA hydratase/isomerase family protein [Streptomyces sp. NBC_00893]SFX45142.1 Enoyl-CoA hydratase/carnithine racemase [Streptomyces atratus]
MSDVPPLLSSADLTITVDSGVAVIAMSRPAKLNALTRDMRRDLAELLRHYGDGSQARGVVITGRGKAFSAGMDLREAAASELDLLAEMKLFNDITRAALITEVPVVAALNGIAVGGAGEMALSFDARIATAQAAISWPETGVGLTVSNAASLFLPRLAGASRALHLIMNSAGLSASQALDLGLLDGIVEPEDLIPAAIRLIHRWTQPGSSTAAHLRLMRPSLRAVEAAMAREAAAVRQVQESGIAQAGIAMVLAGHGR